MNTCNHKVGGVRVRKVLRIFQGLVPGSRGLQQCSETVPTPTSPVSQTAPLTSPLTSTTSLFEPPTTVSVPSLPSLTPDTPPPLPPLPETYRHASPTPPTAISSHRNLTRKTKAHCLPVLTNKRREQGCSERQKERKSLVCFFNGVVKRFFCKGNFHENRDRLWNNIKETKLKQK